MKHAYRLHCRSIIIYHSAIITMISNGRIEVLVLILSVSCTWSQAATITLPKTSRAVAVLSGPSDVKGVIVFESLGDGLTRVVGSLTGLQKGPHGFHVHEFGDLSNG